VESLYEFDPCERVLTAVLQQRLLDRVAFGLIQASPDERLPSKPRVLSVDDDSHTFAAHLGRRAGKTALREYVIVLVPFLQILDGLPKTPMQIPCPCERACGKQGPSIFRFNKRQLFKGLRLLGTGTPHSEVALKRGVDNPQATIYVCSRRRSKGLT
jgi:hypothetical protein